MIRLYHGSNMKIEVPDLVHSKPFKDFGSGFYLSPDKQQAWDMAFQKVNQTKEGKAEVTEFLFDETLMLSEQLKVLNYPDYCEEWALFVLANRDKKATHPIHNYDIVYGPIANDRVGAQIARFKQGYITFDEFLRRIQYIKGITFQYAFCTQKAIDKLIKQK